MDKRLEELENIKGTPEYKDKLLGILSDEILNFVELGTVVNKHQSDFKEVIAAIGLLRWKIRKDI